VDAPRSPAIYTLPLAFKAAIQVIRKSPLDFV
jgi:hypothetical protein